MTERIHFVHDVVCPWCHQTSRWLARLEASGEVALTWGLYSLELAGAEPPATTFADTRVRAERALRTAAAVRSEHGHAATGAFLRAFGTRLHEQGERLSRAETTHGALADAGLPTALADQAMADEAHAKAVLADHHWLADRTDDPGVPQLVLDAGEGPAVFGPVIAEPPADDAAARELLDHVRWFARADGVYELKRDRDRDPPLASVRRMRAREQRAAAAEPEQG